MPITGLATVKKLCLKLVFSSWVAASVYVDRSWRGSNHRLRLIVNKLYQRTTYTQSWPTFLNEKVMVWKYLNSQKWLLPYLWDLKGIFKLVPRSIYQWREESVQHLENGLQCRFITTIRDTLFCQTVAHFPTKSHNENVILGFSDFRRRYQTNIPTEKAGSKIHLKLP